MCSSAFHEDWIKLTVKNYWNLWEFSDDFGNWIATKGYSWNIKALRDMMLNSTAQLASELGDKLVVALSGGIDSQAACLALKTMGVPFTVAIMKFHDNWNVQDTDYAEYFCKIHGLEYKIYELQIFDFLKNDLQKYVAKYSCPSPQLCCHHWLIEQIAGAGATGILLGGDVPYVENNEWSFAMSRSQSSWVSHQAINNILVRSWKTWSKEIAMAFTLTTDSDSTKTFYQNKVNSSLVLGFDIIPQSDKKNGFERVKKYFENLTGNGWTFELLYRHPNYAIAPEYKPHPHVPQSITDGVLTIKNRILDEIKNG
jgi:hypothetical protein